MSAFPERLGGSWSQEDGPCRPFFPRPHPAHPPANPAAVSEVRQKDFPPFLLSAWLISLSGFFCRWK